MNRDEESVRRALHRHAGGIEPGGGSQERIQQRVHETRRRRRLGWAGGATGAVATAVLLVVAVSSLAGNGSRVVETGPAGTGSMPTAPPDSLVKGPPPVPSNLPVPGIWPFHTTASLEAYLDSGDTRYDDPAEVARAFASEYLGMVDPVVGEPSGPGPDGTLDVVVQPHGEGGRVLEPGVLETTIKLDPVGPPWSVLYATSADILLDGPVSGREVTSPVTVTGESRAFEGTVDIEVREDGMGAGEALGRGFVTGGAGPDLGSFSGEVSFEPASTDQGALVLFTTSAADGSVQQATVVDISLPAPGTTEVTVFFHRTEELVPVTRTVPATTGVLRASLEQLLAGPTEVERTSGVSSWFSEATTGMLNDVTLDADGTAVVDLGDLRSVIPNASTSTGSTLLLEQLNATVFQFSTVERVDYRLEGSCDAFFEWLQRGCEVIERPGG
jgi:hypothetical protein